MPANTAGAADPTAVPGPTLSPSSPSYPSASTTRPYAPLGPRPPLRTGPAFFHPTVARLTYRGLLGRRRALLLFALPMLLLIIVAAVRALTGADDGTAAGLLQGFALSAMVPLVGVIAGTGAIGPEIDDGAIVYLLAKPVKRGTIIATKLLVAIGVTVGFCAVPTLLAGYILDGSSQHLAVAFAVAAAVASVAYSAIFLMLGVITRHAVVVGLVYALLWESVIGNYVPGARTLSVQQWSLAIAQKIADGGQVSSDVGLTTSVVLLLVVTGAATWFAGHKLRSLKLAGDE
ncbi:ABC-2 type transport system permease protein [Streptomyces sp. DvalAA-14]|uniref:ABC transporter permease subunit n=1 Tax=unclassified Streptomyces TaxID=2593676 RepID=UPI00081B5301|nr:MULTISPECIES: ABC transporter permease subunit [unclassified Streptomyces]MYS24977.1 ABC transporter permease subunit [Streptomyces sp. SID4948]SCE51041.1 ABC-2 type transport system permease protein [Streptomyces sp. DvalAA-14]